MRRALAVAVLLAACKGEERGEKAEAPAPEAAHEHAPSAAKVTLPPPPPIEPAPLGIDGVSLELPTPELAELGRVLFFDERLSSDGSASCETCHRNDHAFADDDARSIAVGGEKTARNTPSLVNVAYHASNLEAVVLVEWQRHLGADPDRVAAAIGRNPEYAAHFLRATGGEASAARVAKAIAAFVTTIRSGGSPWDRWEERKEAVPAAAQAGYRRFGERCARCHTPPLYTNGAATPTLRSIVKTGPWLRDGSAATLEDAIRRHPDVRVDDADVAGLVALLKALDADVSASAPRLPASGE